MDTVPKFVQLIKLVQQEVGMGNARVRPPRLELVDAELQQTQAIIRRALASRPASTSSVSTTVAVESVGRSNSECNCGIEWKIADRFQSRAAVER
jgi:hypothetical protein